MKKILIYSFTLYCLTSCNKEFENRCFDKQGKITKEIRYLGDFTRMTIWDVFDISLKKDTVNYLEIEAPENILPFIESVIESENLDLFDHTNCKWSREYYTARIILHFKDLYFIKNQSSCKLSTVDTLKCYYMQIYARSELAEMNMVFDAFQIVFIGSHTTSGNYFFSGKCSDFNVETHSAITVDASELYCDSAYFNHNSIGDIKANIGQKLDVAFLNRGNVLLKKMPAKVVILNQTGEGSVKLY